MKMAIFCSEFGDVRPRDVGARGVIFAVDRFVDDIFGMHSKWSLMEAKASPKRI